MLSAVRALIVRAVDTNMPQGVAVKTNSFFSCDHWWAQMGVSRYNLSGVGSSAVLMEFRVRISRFIKEGKSGR